MKILYNWLKEFVEVKAPPGELRTRLSLVGIDTGPVEETPEGPLLDAELTTNRPDCMGHYGIAREVSTLYRLPLKLVEPKLRESAEEVATVTRVDIECPELCGRYTARVIREVKIAPSPEWLRQRLEALGQASINNVVDATNYVMLELGQALHAFDFDRLADHRIVVRRSRPGEKLQTLDGVERALPADACVIADANRGVAIGGIMGGADTEIHLSSKNVLVESAWFDPLSIRRTSKALNLRTEASTRFERGADPEMAERASRRCAELIQQLAGGRILAGVADAYPRRPLRPKIELTRKELLRVMGADVPDAEIEAILAALGFEPVRVDATRGSAGSLMAAWECRQPSWRQDVFREVDLIEEVARHYGYEKFPAKLPAARQPAARLPHAEAEDRLRERLVGLGYQEIVAITIVDPEKDALFRDQGVSPAQLMNPLALDASVLRGSGLPTMAATLEWNLNRGQRNLRLFEIGRSYQRRGAEIIETPVLTLGSTGLAREKGIHEGAREYSFADLKGDIDQLAALCGGLRWHAGGPAWLHPARAGTLWTNGKGHPTTESIGFAGQLARRVADRFKLRQEVFLAELKLAPLLAGYRATRSALRYQPLSKFPAVERDFSLLLPDGTRFADVVAAIRSLGIRELKGVEAIDLFRGGSVPSGKYSLLVRVVFQSDEATLTEAQLTDFTGAIVAVLASSLGATLRAS